MGEVHKVVNDDVIWYYMTKGIYTPNTNTDQQARLKFTGKYTDRRGDL